MNAPVAELAPQRVLLVDDDYMLTKVYADLLARIPRIVTVGAAYDGQSALRMIDQLRPDLVLLDFYLPDMDGLEVLRQSSQPGRHQADTILVTAASDGNTVLRALRSGAMSYIVKPFTSAALNEVVQNWLSTRTMSATATARSELAQPEVDRLVCSRGLAGSPKPNTRPKGIAAETLRMVVTALGSGQRDLSAKEVAEICGLSRVSARRYLQYLVRIDTAGERLQYGSTGRPEHRYFLVRGVNPSGAVAVD